MHIPVESAPQLYSSNGLVKADLEELDDLDCIFVMMIMLMLLLILNVAIPRVYCTKSFFAKNA